MIEIKEGWDFTDTNIQFELRHLNAEIKSLNKKLEAALENRARLQSTCKHNHVSFSGQEMTCEVCGAPVVK